MGQRMFAMAAVARADALVKKVKRVKLLKGKRADTDDVVYVLTLSLIDEPN